MFRQLYTLVVDKLEFPNDYNWIQEGDHILKNIQQYLITYDPKDNLFFPEGIKLKDVQNNSAESEAYVSNVFGSSKVSVKTCVKSGSSCSSTWQDKIEEITILQLNEKLKTLSNYQELHIQTTKQCGKNGRFHVDTWFCLKQVVMKHFVRLYICCHP